MFSCKNGGQVAIMLGYLCSAVLVWLRVVGTASASCNEATLSTPSCANLGELRYPFGEAAPCAASDAFVMSNCSSAQAFWYAFTDSYWSYEPTNSSPPAVMGIDRAGPIVFVNLTWNTALIGSPPCSPPLAASSLSRYFPPDEVDLTRLGSSSYHYLRSYPTSLFSFSPNNIILLLNCTPYYYPHNVEANSSLCTLYQQQCGSPFPNTSTCFQYKPNYYLLLEIVLSDLGCTHFQFYVSMDSTQLPVSQWSKGLVQLAVVDTRCQDCTISNGSCLFDNNLIFSKCFCSNNMNYSDNICYSLDSECIGAFSCSLIAKVVVGVGISVTTLCVLMTLFTLHNWLKKEQNNVTCQEPVQLWFTEDSTGRRFANELVQGIPLISEQPPQATAH